MSLSDAQIRRAMQLLGFQQGDFRAVQTAPSFEAGQKALEELKTRAKKQFRKVAMDLHPDRTNNDPAKTEDFKLVSVVVEELDKLALRRPQPRPQIHIVFQSFGGQTTATTTSSRYWGWGF